MTLTGWERGFRLSFGLSTPPLDSSDFGPPLVVKVVAEDIFEGDIPED